MRMMEDAAFSNFIEPLGSDEQQQLQRIILGEGRLDLPSPFDSQISFTSGTRRSGRLAAATSYLAIPASFRHFLREKNARLVHGVYSDEVHPDGPQQTLQSPTRDDPRVHHNQMGGYYQPKANTAFTFQYKFSENISPQIGQKPSLADLLKRRWLLATPADIAATVRHEILHSLDRNAGLPSCWPEFRAAHTEDIAAMGGPEAARQAGFGYYVQDDPLHGSSETWAETGADLIGGGIGKGAVTKAFPRYAEQTRLLLQDIAAAMKTGFEYCDAYLKFRHRPPAGVRFSRTLEGFEQMKQSERQRQQEFLAVNIVLGAAARLTRSSKEKRYDLDGGNADELRKLFKPEPEFGGTGTISAQQLQQIDKIRAVSSAVLKKSIRLYQQHQSADAAQIENFSALRDAAAVYLSLPKSERSESVDRHIYDLTKATARFVLKLQSALNPETRLHHPDQIILDFMPNFSPSARTVYYSPVGNSFHNQSVYSADRRADREEESWPLNRALSDIAGPNQAALNYMKQPGKECYVPRRIYAAGSGYHCGWVLSEDAHQHEGFTPAYQASATSQELFRLTRQRMREFKPGELQFFDSEGLAEQKNSVGRSALARKEPAAFVF